VAIADTVIGNAAAFLVYQNETAALTNAGVAVVRLQRRLAPTKVIEIRLVFLEVFPGTLAAELSH
jgi:hypothetical protein